MSINFWVSGEGLCYRKGGAGKGQVPSLALGPPFFLNKLLGHLIRSDRTRKEICSKRSNGVLFPEGRRDLQNAALLPVELGSRGSLRLSNPHQLLVTYNCNSEEVARGGRGSRVPRGLAARGGVLTWDAGVRGAACALALEPREPAPAEQRARCPASPAQVQILRHPDGGAQG